MDAQTIDTMALIRQIRDDHYQCLEGKMHAERIAFYREQAQKMQSKIAALLQRKPFDYTKLETTNACYNSSRRHSATHENRR